MKQGVSDTERASFIVQRMSQDLGWRETNLPSPFFMHLLETFELRMEEYREQIKKVEELLLPERERGKENMNTVTTGGAYGQKEKVTKKMLYKIIEKQHEAFISVTGLASELSSKVEDLKDAYRRECLHAAEERGVLWKDPFEEAERKEEEVRRRNEMKELMAKKIAASNLASRGASSSSPYKQPQPQPQGSQSNFNFGGLGPSAVGNAGKTSSGTSGSGFSFGLGSNTAAPTTTGTTPATGSGGFSFGTAAPTTTGTAPATGAGGFSFGNAAPTTAGTTPVAGGFSFGSGANTGGTTPATGGFSFGTGNNTAAPATNGSSLGFSLNLPNTNTIDTRKKNSNSRSKK